MASLPPRPWFGKARLYERMLLEKDREIDILAEQIDWLRLQLAHLGRAVEATPLQLPTPDGANVEVQPYVADEELDAQALLEAGRITRDQLPDVLEALGMVPDLHFDS